ncbi:MAG TPA: tetratricopeptide repeat protein [Solirubrobacteraceae bacterium]|nr:tetratricopeptide repeat protein [Solirubrobacteraceae bacterium]
METPSSTTSWQAEKEQRERTLYVPRYADGVLAHALAGGEDGERKLVFAVAGDGGLGKSTLIGHFKQVAIDSGCLCAISDQEAAPGVPESLADIAGQLREQGAPLGRFEERYKRYQEQMHRLKSDPSAPLGVAGLVAGTVARVGLSAIEEVPGGSLAVSAVDKQTMAEQAAAWADFVATKTKRAEDRRLVLDPEGELSPNFLDDLRTVARERHAILCFDTYEQTGSYLDAWLRAVIDGSHGEVPLSVRIVVAGRRELSRNDWAPYEWLLARIRLQPFTVEQSRDYLTSAGITDQRVVHDYHASTGGMPLLLATLAAAPIVEGAPPRAGADVAVERFLDAIPGDEDRDAVIDAALPRLLNEETFAVACAQHQQPPSFGWLVHLPFVDEHPRGWIYHDVVRTHMLALHQRLKPQRWAETHTRLSEYYERRLEQGKQLLTAERLAIYAEYVYHLLCARPERLAEMLSDVIVLTRRADEIPFVCAEAIAEAGRAAGLPHLVRWGESTLQALTALRDEAWPATMGFLDEVMTLELSAEARGTAHMLKAVGAFDERAFDIAAAEATSAMQALPDPEQLASTIIATARVIHGDVLAAFELAPDMLADSSPVTQIAGLVGSGRFEEAAAAAKELLSEDPDNDVLLYLRGTSLLRLGYGEEALHDLERAVELDPDMPEYRVILARAYLVLDRPDDALAQTDDAIAMRPQSPVFRSVRAEVLAALGRRSEALEAAGHAIETWPGIYSYWSKRAVVYARFGDYADALADVRKTLELIETAGSPILADHVETLMQLGDTLEHLGDSAAASANLTRAVEIARTGGDMLLLTALVGRANVAGRQRRYADAAQDWREALALTRSIFGPAHLKSATAQLSLGMTLILSGDDADALDELETAAEYYEKQELNGRDLANALYWLGRARSALDSSAAEDPLRRAIALYEQQGPERHDALAVTLEQLVSVYRKLARDPPARTTLERLLLLRRSLDGDYSQNLRFALHELGMTLKEQGESSAAIAALEWSLDVNDDTDPDAGNVAETLRALAELAADQPQSPPPVPSALSHSRAELAHLRYRALAGADLSADLRRAIAEHAGSLQELASSCTSAPESTAAEVQVAAQQAIAPPQSAVQQALAAYAAREAALGPELMRALERHLVLTAISESIASARAATTSPEDSTQTRKTLLSRVWKLAARYLFLVEVEVQDTPQENTA